MSNPKKEQQKVYDAFDLIKYAWDKRWVLLGASFLAAIIAILVSLQLKDKYQSTAVIFPAEKISPSRNLVETPQLSWGGGRGILGYGHEEDGERMLQILKSTQMRDYVIEKFNLPAHYDLQPEKEEFFKSKLYGKYSKNINFKPTKYMSIEITVTDEDPVFAADIANEIADYVDSTIYNMQKYRLEEGYKIINKEYLISKKELKEISDSLQKIQTLGVFDYKSQAETLNEAYATALERGNIGATYTIQKKLNTLAIYGNKYIELSEKFESAIKRTELLKDRLSLAKVELKQILPNVYMVSKAEVSDRKSEPKRSVIVFMSTLSTFAMMLLLLLIFDGVKAKF